MDQTQKKPQLLILMLLFSFANAMGIMYTAALPELTKSLHITKFQTQDTFSIYVLGCLLAQLFYAPFANALGRKPAVYIGGSLAIIGSLLCLIAVEASSFSLLLVGRGLTALGAGCGVILTNTMIADSFPFAEAKKFFSFLLGGFAIFPSVGITIGGFITEYLSWKGCFYYMLFYSLFVVSLSILLPETAKEKNLSHLNVKKIAKSYFKQARNIPFLFYAVIVAFACNILYVLSSEAPFIATHQMHISPDHFGSLALIPYAGLFLGGILSGKLGHRFSAKILLLVGALVFLAAAGIMWACFANNIITIATLFGFPFLVFFSFPIIVSNGQTLSLAVSEDKAYASSIMSMFQFAFIFVSILSLRCFSPENAAALPIMYTISGILMLVFWCIIKKIRSHPHVEHL